MTRVLARSLEPLPEESLPGYLLRLAYRLGSSPGRIAELCGIHDGRQRRLAAHILLELPVKTAAEFARRTRLDPAQVHCLGLRRYAASYPALRTRRGMATAPSARRPDSFFGSIKDLYSDRWAVNFSSRYCPTCLDGDGSPVQNAYGGPWNLRWHLPVVFACTTHQKLLASHCPACRSPLNRQAYEGRATLLSLPTTPHQLHPGQCRNHTAGRGSRAEPCGARLDKETRYPYSELPVADHVSLLELQDRIDQRLTHPATEEVENLPMEFSSFQDLVDTAQLIKLSWPAARDWAPSPALAALIDEHTAPLHASLDAAPHFSPLRRAPQDSSQCGALLLAAEALLRDASDPPALHERIHPLAQYAIEHAPAGASRAFFSRPGLSTALSRAMARRKHGFYAAGPLEYANLRVASRDCHFSAEEVPAHLPQLWYAAYFTDFADQVPGAGRYTVRHIRRAASLKLVEMTAGGSWRDAARVLDIPDSRALSSLTKLRRQIGDADLWPRFEAATEQIARHLDGLTERTNYAHRRRRLTNWLMPYADWSAISTGLSLSERFTAHHGITIGTVIAWTEVTQSDFLLCPLLAASRQSTAERDLLVAEISRFFSPTPRRGHRVALHGHLAAYARELATHVDMGKQLLAGA